MKPTPKPGDIVEVRIIDHAEDTDDVQVYLVYGRVVRVTRRGITLDSWALADPLADRDLEKHNIKPFALVRKAIESITILRRAEEGA